MLLFFAGQLPADEVLFRLCLRLAGATWLDFCALVPVADSWASATSVAWPRTTSATEFDSILFKALSCCSVTTVSSLSSVGSARCPMLPRRSRDSDNSSSSSSSPSPSVRETRGCLRQFASAIKVAGSSAWNVRKLIPNSSVPRTR